MSRLDRILGGGGVVFGLRLEGRCGPDLDPDWFGPLRIFESLRELAMVQLFGRPGASRQEGSDQKHRCDGRVLVAGRKARSNAAVPR